MEPDQILLIATADSAKLRDGAATFKNVRIEAEQPGSYMLRAKSASRKARSLCLSPCGGNSFMYEGRVCACVVSEICFGKLSDDLEALTDFISC